MARVFVVGERIHVNAPVERCFLLSANLELVKRSWRMRLVAGRSTRTSGQVESGDRIVWRGWMLGLPRSFEVLVTRYEWPDFFQTTIERGPFQRFQHDHTFVEVGGRTLLKTKVRFSLPLGWLTRPAGHFLVTFYLPKMLRQRMQLLKRVAESAEWKEYLARGG